MRHKINAKTLRRNTAQRKSLLRNLVTSFLEKERMRTTLAKAKAARPLAEKMITLSKRNTLHSRRQALQFIYKKEIVKKLFDDIGPRFSERPGGYTRIIKLGPRAGDGADMAIARLTNDELQCLSCLLFTYTVYIGCATLGPTHNRAVLVNCNCVCFRASSIDSYVHILRRLYRLGFVLVLPPRE